MASGDYAPSPSNTRGFLYLYRPPLLPPIASEIHFRPEPDPRLFSTGANLIKHNSIPWAISLAQIVKIEVYAPFKAQLISDGFLDPDFLASLELAWEGYTSRNLAMQAIYTLGQPFEMNLASSTTTISVFTMRAQGSIEFRQFFVDRRTSRSPGPYTGHILVRFEISPFVKHARPSPRPPVLVLRVLKIVTPIEVVAGYDMHVPMPTEGGFLANRKG
ncbi:hypothetical protein DXG03_003854 [Asterophora parasitica]|uniref:Uncharacterized protein n=1 Tax=Asterophora parasitica TaxID=117018 RepID=A0A9P7G784_9AGAR|nr:hypothetical protein DXG03_003854 [Asterophora parasitica]